MALKASRFSADYAVERRDDRLAQRRRRICPGKTHPDETVIYTAHWDHLGVGMPDAKGDTIYNGAVDNATGIAQLIELARAFAHEPRTERSVVFLAVTAEEKGLLGSEYYAHEPALSRWARRSANINMDGAAVCGPAQNFSISGDAKLGLLDDLIAEGKAHGRYLHARPASGGRAASSAPTTSPSPSSACRRSASAPATTW